MGTASLHETITHVSALKDMLHDAPGFRSLAGSIQVRAALTRHCTQLCAKQAIQDHACCIPGQGLL